MHRRRWRSVALTLLLTTTLLGSARPAQAAILRRHTILGKVFRMTPAGRVVATFEARRDV